MDWSNQLIALMAENTRIAKHAHCLCSPAEMPVLRRMHRRYRPWHYREKIEKFRAAVPTAESAPTSWSGSPQKPKLNLKIRAASSRTAFYLPARLHLLGATRDARSRIAESEPAARRPRA